jgi:hypothetical protein
MTNIVYGTLSDLQDKRLAVVRALFVSMGTTCGRFACIEPEGRTICQIQDRIELFSAHRQLNNQRPYVVVVYVGNLCVTITRSELDSLGHEKDEFTPSEFGQIFPGGD